MEPLLKLLRENASYSSAQLAQLLDMEESEVKTRIQALEDDRTILGYMALINDEKKSIFESLSKALDLY